MHIHFLKVDHHFFPPCHKQLASSGSTKMRLQDAAAFHLITLINILGLLKLVCVGRMEWNNNNTVKEITVTLKKSYASFVLS